MSDLSLSDLRVQRGIDHNCGMTACRVIEDRPATLADLRAVLEAEGALSVTVKRSDADQSTDGVYLEAQHPGTYLVWRIEEVDSE